MAMNLSELLIEVYAAIGQLEVGTASGGSTTTLVDSQRAGSERRDDVWKDAHLLVISAGGAAPEGEFQRISAYADATGTFTLGAAFSAAVEADDRYGLVNNYYPLDTIIELLNAGLHTLGDIPMMDTTTLDTASGQTEYAAAVAWKRRPPFRIDYQGQTGDADDNQWARVYDWEFVPSAPGQAGLIVFRQELPAGRDVRVWYMDAHPKLESHDDVVAEVIAPALAVAAGVEQALRWQNSRLEGGNPFLLQRWNDAKRELDRMGAIHPIWRPRRVGRSKLAGLGRA